MVTVFRGKGPTMTNSTITAASSRDARRARNRRLKAILAGGLVLGVGAAVTLAAWNDSEFATGSFTAGSFDMVGSTDGTTFANHTSAPGATLPFSLNYNNLSPNTTVAAPFVLHLTPGTTTSATVAVATAAGSGAAAANLTYGIQAVASVAACTPTATGTTIVPAGTAMSAVTGAATFQLAKSVDGSAVGANEFLCIQVTAGTGLAQGSTATGTWEFLATSNAS